MNKGDTVAAMTMFRLHYQAANGVDLIDKLSLKKESVVLDLGCGTGHLSSVLAERVGNIAAEPRAIKSSHDFIII